MDNFIYFAVTNEKVSYFPLQRIQIHFCNHHCHYQAKEKKLFPSDRVSKKISPGLNITIKDDWTIDIVQILLLWNVLSVKCEMSYVTNILF